jgi:predicted amidohydrolase
MKFAAIQLDTIPCEVNFNVHKAMQWGKRAFDEGANFCFFHEGLTADYSPDPMRDGRSLESVEVFGFTSLAKQYDGYIALGLNEVWKGQPYISMVLIGPEGIIDVYRKSYLWPNKSQHGKDDFDEWVQSYIPHEQGYRQEKGVLAHGEGTKIVQVGKLRIGCIICADGSQPKAWETFSSGNPDLIFWQNNRGNVVKPGNAQQHAKELNLPMVVTNRCGFSYHHFQQEGSCIIANDGSVIAKANEEGDEEIIYASSLPSHRILIY